MKKRRVIVRGTRVVIGTLECQELASRKVILSDVRITHWYKQNYPLPELSVQNMLGNIFKNNPFIPVVGKFRIADVVEIIDYRAAIKKRIKDIGLFATIKSARKFV